MDKVMQSDSIANYHSFIRELIKEENAISNHRMTWLILLQGLLFTGYANLSDKGLAPYIIGLLGVGISLCIKSSFIFNNRAMEGILKKRYISFTIDGGA